MLEKAEVSKFYSAVYQNKTDLLRQNLTRLDALLGRDLFYDTDTVLELQDPDSKRKALLIQTDMDVDTDGSDPERWNEVDATDPNFQPLTNYKWLKRMPAVVSPLVKVYQDRIDKLEAEAKTPAARKGTAASLQTLREDLYGVEHYSSLIARNDPYVVLPSFMARGGAGGFSAAGRRLCGGGRGQPALSRDLRRQRAEPPARGGEHPGRAGRGPSRDRDRAARWTISRSRTSFFRVRRNSLSGRRTWDTSGNVARNC